MLAIRYNDNIEECVDKIFEWRSKIIEGKEIKYIETIYIIKM